MYYYALYNKRPNITQVVSRDAQRRRAGPLCYASIFFAHEAQDIPVISTVRLLVFDIDNP